MIRLEQVSAGIGRVQILRDVDICVEPGKLVLVLGANGAGKTTSLKKASQAERQDGTGNHRVLLQDANIQASNVPV